MFIELTAKKTNIKWTININNIVAFLPLQIEKGTRIYFISDNTSLDVIEDYETIKTIINKTRF